MAGHLLAEPSFHPEIGCEEPALGGLVVLDLGDAVRHPAGVAEEELEQELAAEGLVPRRDGEPARELSTPFLGERIDVTVGLAALLFAPPRGEALGGQPIQDRVDLPVALVPEGRDRGLDQLLDVVARHRAEAQHPEDREAARALARGSRHPAQRGPTPTVSGAPKSLSDAYP